MVQETLVMVYSPIRMTWSSECTNQTLLAGSRAPITGKKVRGPFRECQWPDLEGALRLIASRASTWGGIGLLRSDPASPNYGHWLSKEEVHASRHLILPIVSSSYTIVRSRDSSHPSQRAPRPSWPGSERRISRQTGPPPPETCYACRFLSNRLILFSMRTTPSF